MTKPTLQIIGLGSARALTRDQLGGPATEIQVRDSIFPAAG